jgi:hypothetical protein
LTQKIYPDFGQMVESLQTFDNSGSSYLYYVLCSMDQPLERLKNIGSKQFNYVTDSPPPNPADQESSARTSNQGDQMSL